MMQKRWQLIEFVPGGCADGFTLSGSGDAGVDGRYCPDGEHLGYPRWTKVGGTSMADSIHIIMPGGPIVQWVVTSGGTYAADPLNVKAYSDFGTYTEPQPPNNTWITSTGGTFPQPEYQVEAATEVSVIRTLTPTGGGKFARERDLSNGCYGYRRKLSSALNFSGDDYKFFRTYEKSSKRRCHEFTIRRQWKCGSQWKTLWIGTFSTGGGNWDYGRCDFAVKPEPLDEYTCLIKQLDAKRNVLKVGPVNVNIYPTDAYEFAICAFGVSEPSECPEYQDDPFDPVTGWALVSNYLGPSPFIAVYSRKVARTICIDGTPVPPPTGTWVLLEDNCATDGTAKYVATGDLNAADITGPFEGTCVDGVAVAPDDIVCPGTVFNINGCGGTYTYFDGVSDVDVVLPPYFVCLGGTPEEQDRARKVYDVLRMMLDDSGCEVGEIQSDFFEWNAPGDTVGYALGTNYVTGAENHMRHLLLVQKSDALDPTATNPATIGEWTLKQLLTVFSVGMRVYWRIEADGTFRLEHYKGWASPIGTDITAMTTVEPMKLDSLKGDVPRFENLKEQDSVGTDFSGADIQYSGPCVTDEEKAERKSYSIDICADVPNILSAGNTASKEGFLMLATRYNGSDYDVINDIGALSLLPVSNAPLSVANLMRDYWTWDRYLGEGLMNGEDTVFDGSVPNKEQKGVAVKMCCDIFGFDPSDRVSTALGKMLGPGTSQIYAQVQREEVNEADETVRLTLRYSY